MHEKMNNATSYDLSQQDSSSFRHSLFRKIDLLSTSVIPDRCSKSLHIVKLNTSEFVCKKWRIIIFEIIWFLS